MCVARHQPHTQSRLHGVAYFTGHQRMMLRRTSVALDCVAAASARFQRRATPPDAVGGRSDEVSAALLARPLLHDPPASIGVTCASGAVVNTTAAAPAAASPPGFAPTAVAAAALRLLSVLPREGALAQQVALASGLPLGASAAAFEYLRAHCEFVCFTRHSALGHERVAWAETASQDMKRLPLDAVRSFVGVLACAAQAAHAVSVAQPQLRVGHVPPSPSSSSQGGAPRDATGASGDGDGADAAPGASLLIEEIVGTLRRDLHQEAAARRAEERRAASAHRHMRSLLRALALATPRRAGRANRKRGERPGAKRSSFTAAAVPQFAS